MSDHIQDELWPHFVPIWTDLRKITPGLLLAGGYGLFLKQQWLVSQGRSPGSSVGPINVSATSETRVEDEIRTVVPMHRWREQTPRVTKDFDFLIDLDLIASPGEQHLVHEVLEQHGFKVVPQNARWQFAKVIGEGRNVVLDFHAPSPGQKRNDLRVQSRRVKPQPSLGQTGVHGRENPEAIGSELHPFSFKFRGLEIVLPNPLTLAVMKITAMHDRWLVSQDASKSSEVRDLERRQAQKHTEDVFRIVAMMTREEREAANEVLKVVRDGSSYLSAARTYLQFFNSDQSWGPLAVEDKWQPEDFRSIQTALAAWFA
jgi:hypothetical protein